MDILLKDGKLCEFRVLGLYGSDLRKLNPEEKMYSAHLYYSGYSIVTVFFILVPSRPGVVEVHVDSNEKLIKKFDLPRYKHTVNDDYTYGKKYVTKKVKELYALDLGLKNLSVMMREIQVFCEGLTPGSHYSQIFIARRVTGSQIGRNDSFGRKIGIRTGKLVVPDWVERNRGYCGGV